MVSTRLHLKEILVTTLASELNSGSFYDLNVYQKKSAFGSLTDIFDSRPEQTLGGAAIGLGRDALSAPESDEKRLERAQENDMACQIAADTVAIIPTVRALPAGLARATMLVNPHNSVQENLGAYTLNVGEGMALNYVGKSMLPGSSLQGALARNIEGQLSREIATHLSVGAGFGLVKSSFDTKNWSDEHGNFTPGKLTANVAKSTLAGALINVPAGMVGTRVMQGPMSLMAELNAPKQLATTLATAGSGYTSGAVFGGIDAVSQGKSFSETLSAMHFAGKVGLVTGGVMGSVDNGSLHSKQRAIVESVLKANAPTAENAPARGDRALSKSTNVSAETLSGPAIEKISRSKPGSDEFVPAVAPEQNGKSLSDRLDYSPVTDYRLSDVSARLKNPRQSVEVDFELKPSAANKTFESHEDFMKHTRRKEVPVRVYDIEGHSAQLVVEESLAVKMDKVRDLRLKVEREAHTEIPFDKLPAAQRYKISLEMQKGDESTVLAKYFDSGTAKRSFSVLRARQTMLRDPKTELLPEDFIIMLDEVPNRRKVARLFLSERANPQDRWNQQTYKDPTFESAATASSDREIRYYLTDRMPKDKPTLRGFMKHEWVHLAVGAAPEEAGLHQLAILVDKDVPNPKYAPVERTTSSAMAKAAIVGKPESGLQFPEPSSDKPTDKHFARAYARTNPDEDGAVHLGEEMLAPDSDRLVALGENAPVRTVWLARILAKNVASAKWADLSTHAPVIGERLAYVQNEVMPDAIKLLEHRVKQGSASERAASAELLGHLGDGERHIPILRKLAADPDALVVPEELPVLARIGSKEPVNTTNGGRQGISFEADGQGRTVADIAFDAMLKLHAGAPDTQLAFLVTEAHPDSPTRELALTRLGSAKHDAASKYLELASLSGRPEKLPQLIDLIRRMPDTNGRVMAFQEALALGANSPQFRRSLIGHGLEIPGVAGMAIDLLHPHEVGAYEPQLSKLARQVWDKPAQEKARVLLSELNSGTDTGRVMDLLRSDSPRAVQQGVDIVIASKSADNRLIRPLLEVAASAPEATSKAARQALLRFNHQLVKFHAQELRRGGVAKPEVLDAVISNR